ncbi:hypothetical protein [Serratia sp. AKBS12]|uniref:hypothetical protein n=1 Tax=Serratia sp. AKBS12 TaxID=2974597 RepID=UPI00216504DE|nr:hypothetical protein [Serratia sp. AKBS12]MCS3407230.1 hypothetical protein [Serratia sp. AKBS12]HEI8868177.1 hypothetical protein [Serratia odorifera]
MKSECKRHGVTALVIFLFSILLLQGCVSQEDPRVVAAVEDKPFSIWFDKLVRQTEQDPIYKRIPIDTTAQSKEFLLLLHDTYRHRITKQAFSQRVNTQYPNHQYETAFIVARLP